MNKDPSTTGGDVHFLSCMKNIIIVRSHHIPGPSRNVFRRLSERYWPTGSSNNKSKNHPSSSSHQSPNRAHEIMNDGDLPRDRDLKAPLTSGGDLDLKYVGDC